MNELDNEQGLEEGFEEDNHSSETQSEDTDNQELGKLIKSMKYYQSEGDKAKAENKKLRDEIEALKGMFVETQKNVESLKPKQDPLTPPTPPSDLYDPEAVMKYQRDFLAYQEKILAERESKIMTVAQQLENFYAEEAQKKQVAEMRANQINNLRTEGASEKEALEMMQTFFDNADKLTAKQFIKMYRALADEASKTKEENREYNYSMPFSADRGTAENVTTKKTKLTNPHEFMSKMARK